MYILYSCIYLHLTDNVGLPVCNYMIIINVIVGNRNDETKNGK